VVLNEGKTVDVMIALLEVVDGTNAMFLDDVDHVVFVGKKASMAPQQRHVTATIAKKDCIIDGQ
jgi:hypothetical protein